MKFVVNFKKLVLRALTILGGSPKDKDFGLNEPYLMTP